MSDLVSSSQKVSSQGPHFGVVDDGNAVRSFICVYLLEHRHIDRNTRVHLPWFACGKGEERTPRSTASSHIAKTNGHDIDNYNTTVAISVSCSVLFNLERRPKGARQRKACCLVSNSTDSHHSKRRPTPWGEKKNRHSVEYFIQPTKPTVGLFT